MRVLPHVKRLDDCFGDFLVRVVCGCGCGACREITPEALVFLTRRSDIVFAGRASWRNTARHGSDAEVTHENHQFRCAGCRSTTNRSCVPGHLLRCAARCRAPSERGHHRASGAQIEWWESYSVPCLIECSSWCAASVPTPRSNYCCRVEVWCRCSTGGIASGWAARVISPIAVRTSEGGPLSESFFARNPREIEPAIPEVVAVARPRPRRTPKNLR